MEKDIISKINGLKANFKCDKCENIQKVNVFPYINFNENPEYYALVKELDVFKVKCEKCGKKSIIKYDALYLNESLKYFIYLLTDKSLIDKFRHQITYFIETVLNKDEKYDFDLYKTRLVFNTNQLIEKMSIFEYGLDDKVIEMIKYGFYEKGILNLTKYDSIYFDGMKETNLEFILFNSNVEDEMDKIFIDFKLYNQIVDRISKLSDENFVFPNIDQDWINLKISNINKNENN